VGEKKGDVSKYVFFFGGCGKISEICLIVFFKSPCCETPKNAIQPWVKKKAKEKKTFFVMSPDGLFRKRLLSCF
jgi:hypothetical protein